MKGQIQLPDESFSVSDIQHYLEYVIKKHKAIINNRPIQIYINKIESRITFKVKADMFQNF